MKKRVIGLLLALVLLMSLLSAGAMASGGEGGCTSAVNCFALYTLMSVPFIFIALFYLPFLLSVTICASTLDTVLLATSSPSMYV